MKKLLLIFAIAISTVYETKSMGYIIRLERYLFNSPTELVRLSAEPLPIINTFQEFKDGQEFIPRLNGQPPNRLLPNELQTYCSGLHNGTIPCISIKDAEILKFARDMATYEKTWKDWYTIDKWSDHNEFNRTLKHIRIPQNKHHLETQLLNLGNNKIVSIRRDEHSPYYEWVATTNQNIIIDNLRENEAYHNELKFLQTQLHKMDLYWNITPQEEKDLQQEEFNKTRKTLVQEIESFEKNRMNRISFTHSCLHATDFDNLQFARNSYKINQGYSDFNHLNKINDFQQKYQISRELKKQIQQKAGQQIFRE